MTNETPKGEGLSPEEALTIAENHFGRALQLFEEHLQDLDTAGGVRGSEVAKTALEARKAMQVLFEERYKIEQFRKKASGVVHDFALDLDAARDEIGRRLSCLRDAAGPEEIPD
ncbi:MAG: hypothetical protein GY945_15985 [Rhodobacteraceae bacterium]|nr:hypothetical protein [Paracoccaceae bacterium]